MKRCLLCLSDLDDGIRDAVILLRRAGFQTFTSCEGGRGHSFRHGTIGLALEGNYPAFQKRLVTFLRSQRMRDFTISLVTDYTADHPEGRRCVYIEGLDILSDAKRRKVIDGIRRKDRRLRRQLGEMGVRSPTRARKTEP